MLYIEVRINDNKTIIYMNSLKFKIQDFEKAIYPIIKSNIELFEVATIYKNTMNKGRIKVSEPDVVFEPLKTDSYAMRVLKNIRGHETPKLKETDHGVLLTWSNFGIKIKK